MRSRCPRQTVDLQVSQVDVLFAHLARKRHAACGIGWNASVPHGRIEDAGEHPITAMNESGRFRLGSPRFARAELRDPDLDVAMTDLCHGNMSPRWLNMKSPCRLHNCARRGLEVSLRLEP